MVEPDLLEALTKSAELGASVRVNVGFKRVSPSYQHIIDRAERKAAMDADIAEFLNTIRLPVIRRLEAVPGIEKIIDIHPLVPLTLIAPARVFIEMLSDRSSPAHAPNVSMSLETVFHAHGNTPACPPEGAPAGRGGGSVAVAQPRL